MNDPIFWIFFYYSLVLFPKQKHMVGASRIIAEEWCTFNYMSIHNKAVGVRDLGVMSLWFPFKITAISRSFRAFSSSPDTHVRWSWCTVTKQTTAGVLCNIWYRPETYLKLKSCEISFAHKLLIWYPTVLKLCTEHVSDTALFTISKRLDN